jgi:hypothetical protein
MDIEKTPVGNIKWIESTMRNGTKTPKICRDMFLSEYKGEFKLVVVKNGRVFSKEPISVGDASRLQRLHNLKGVEGIFIGAYAYRTQDSNALIRRMLISVGC